MGIYEGLCVREQHDPFCWLLVVEWIGKGKNESRDTQTITVVSLKDNKGCDRTDWMWLDWMQNREKLIPGFLNLSN